MPSYTQEELLKAEFSEADKGILGGLLKTGLYIMGGNSKIGKSMIATSLANAVATGTDYLGKSNKKAKVVYFDNDNYDYEAKSRIKALNFGANENIKYYFGEEARSLRSIEEELEFKIGNISEYSLVIIDSFIGLREFLNMDCTYQNIYPILTKFRDFVIELGVVCIILHHNKKGEAKGQDKLIGPKAMSGATTGTIIINVENEFSDVGKLEFILRHKKEIIPIKKDENGVGWILDDIEDSTSEEIPRNILNLINSVVSVESHQIKGTVQEIVKEARMEVNPASLFKYLKKNKSFLDQNNITFEKIRTHDKRLIKIEYKEITD